jgi:hypothetical protein
MNILGFNVNPEATSIALKKVKDLE